MAVFSRGSVRVLGAVLLTCALDHLRDAELAAQGQPRQDQAGASGQDAGALEPTDSTDQPGWLSIVDFQKLGDKWNPKFDLELPGGGSWLTGGDARVPPPPSTNANAPWFFEGRVRHEGRSGAFSAGVVGVRNYSLPLYSASAIGGRLDPGPTSSSLANFYAPSIQWNLTAAVERTLKTTAGGATIGVAADGFLPLDPPEQTNDKTRTDSPSSRAFRLGSVLRWK